MLIRYYQGIYFLIISNNIIISNARCLKNLMFFFDLEQLANQRLTSRQVNYKQFYLFIEGNASLSNNGAILKYYSHIYRHLNSRIYTVIKNIVLSIHFCKCNLPSIYFPYVPLMLNRLNNRKRNYTDL